MKRITQLAKELKTPIFSIMNALKELGLSVNSEHSKIDEETIRLVIEKLRPKKREDKQQKQIHPSTNLPSVTDLPIEFEYHNQFEAAQLEMLTNEGLFINRNPQLRLFEETTIETIFSDFEAFSICAGLEDRRARKAAKNFFANKDVKEDVCLYAHQVAMLAIKHYGPQMLTYVVSLPPLPFKALDATQLFRELDKRKTSNRFPILRITYYNDENKREKIQIGFYASTGYEGRMRYDNVLEVKNKSTGDTLMKIARDGRVLPNMDIKQMLPQILLFIRFSQDVQKYILNYGLETGECSICGRELTDPISIKLGIGPICNLR